MIHTYEYKKWIESDSDEAREGFMASCKREGTIEKTDRFSGPSGARYLIVDVEDGKCRTCHQHKPTEEIWRTCRECGKRNCLKDEYIESAEYVWRGPDSEKAIDKMVDADIAHQRHGL